MTAPEPSTETWDLWEDEYARSVHPSNWTPDQTGDDQ